MVMIKKVLLIIGFIAFAGFSQATENNCLICHQDFEEEDGPSYKINRDIHTQKGIGCVDCHGGDTSLDDMDDVREEKSYVGVPTYSQVPEFCARCHSNAEYMHEFNPSLPTDQLERYKTSVHGKRLYRYKDKKVATCISCHSVHEIGNADMPLSSTYPINIPQTCGKCHSNKEYMDEYNIPTNQGSDYKQSIHGFALFELKDLSAPVCNDCHGNHGAAPPGVSSLTAVCGNCHAIEAELFDNSPHKSAYLKKDYPMCLTCHSNHKIIKPFDAMVGNTVTALCTECHYEDDGTKGLETAFNISTAIRKLVAAHDEARKSLDAAAIKGMVTTDEEFRLKEVGQALIQVRTLVHSYNSDSVLPKAEEGILKAETVIANSGKLIDEYYFRRKGLGLVTLIITIMAIAIYIKTKRVDE